jgi:hypothetical protein
MERPVAHTVQAAIHGTTTMPSYAASLRQEKGEEEVWDLVGYFCPCQTNYGDDFNDLA